MSNKPAEHASAPAVRARRVLRRFPDAQLKSRFLPSYCAATRPWIRGLLVALSTVLGFTVIDHWLLGGAAFAV